MKSDLSKVEVGDKIWTIHLGWIEVTRIDTRFVYPVITGCHSYTFDGKFRLADKYPSAFLECPFKEQPIEKDTIVWFRDYEDATWRVGYYSHFENGKHWCFVNSKKSTETNTTNGWKIVTTENPLI